MKTREIYTHVSNKDIGKIKSPLDMWGGIIPIQDDMRIADIPELGETTAMNTRRREHAN